MKNKLEHVKHLIRETVNYTDTTKIKSKIAFKIFNEIFETYKIPKYIEPSNLHYFYNTESYKLLNLDYSKPYMREEYKVFTNLLPILNESSNFIYPSKYKEIEAILQKEISQNIDITPIKINNKGIAYKILISGEPKLITQIYEKNSIESKMEAFGYYNAAAFGRTNANNEKVLIYQFEPYYSDIVEFPINSILTHTTLRTNKDNILKFGLYASADNKIFKYPKRIYFYTIPEINKIKTYFYESKKCELNEIGKN